MRARTGMLLIASSLIVPTWIILVSRPAWDRVTPVEKASPQREDPQEPMPDPPAPGMCRLTGRIVDERGAVIEHAQVELQKEHDFWYEGPHQVESDARGRFRFDCEAARVKWLGVKAWVSEFRTIVRQPSASRGDYRARVPAPALDDLGDLVLEPAGVVEGRVVSQRGPIMRANIDVARSADDVRSVQTGAGGTFRIGSLEPGVWALFSRATGYVPGPRTIVVVTAGEVRATDDIVLEDGFAIEGIVVGPDDRPIGLPTILGRSLSGESVRAVASASGVFLLRVPSPEPYTLSLERTPAGFAPWEGYFGSHTFRPGQFARIRLEREH